jgi:exosortase
MRAHEWGVLAVLLTIFAPALGALASVWTSEDGWSHGFLVPVVALWALLRDRYRWPSGPGAPDPRAAAGLLAAGCGYLVGVAAALPFLQGLSLVAALASAVWLLRGPAWLRALAFPLAFLLFMVPLPADWTAPVIVRLQIGVSEAAVRTLHALAIPAAREGNVLVLEDGASLFVAEACSGVTSLLTLLPLAVVLARSALRGGGRRALLVALVVPFAMLGNLLRVVGTVLLVGLVGLSAATEGPLHDGTGLAAFLVACLLLLGTAGLLRERGRC